ncbi:MAG: hypothetical protein ACRCXX_12615 [Cetobacterium sp.]|uniref:hypothetical protein n=1 Tax=Cetobacterium sp. TaxID=2071632 RepID=UPI003F3F63DE
MIGGIITGILSLPYAIKVDRLNRGVIVEVNENGDVYYRTVTVKSLIQHMKDFDCEPFSDKDILRAMKIKTVAIGWMYTSFELIFDDESSEKVFAIHGD